MTAPKPRPEARPYAPPLTAGERAQAMANACKVALQFAWAVSGRNAPLIQRICNELSREDLAALAIVCAAAADGTKLLVVTKTAVPTAEEVA